MNRHKATQSQSVVMTTDQSGRSRKQIKFWLDATKPDQAAMGEALDTMRKDKKQNFAGFMRDAIALMLALLAGDISVLMRLFPDVIHDIRNEATIALHAENARLKAQIEALQEEIAEDNDIIEAQDKELAILRKQKDNRQPSASVDFEAMMQSFNRLESKLDGMQRQPATIGPQSHENGVHHGLQPMTLPKPAGPQSLNVPSFSSPTFDDEDDMLEVKRDENAGDVAVQNFLKSAMGLQGLEHGN